MKKQNDNELSSHLSQLIIKAKSGYEHYKGVINELNDAYMLLLKPEINEYLTQRNKSKNFIPKLNAKAKRIYDGLSETYFNNDKFAKLEPYINSSDDVISKWQEALDFYTQRINLYRTFAPIFLQAPFTPLCVVKVFWENDSAKIENVSIDEIFFDPKAKDNADIRYIVNKISLTYDDIARLVKKRIFKSEILQAINAQFDYERFELYEVYEKIDNQWYLSTIYDESIILRKRVKLKDGQPFVWGYMLPQIKGSNDENYVCAYGEPVLASMLPLQHEVNVIRNLMVDTIRQGLMPKVMLAKSAMIDSAELESVGGYVSVDGGGGAYLGTLPSGDISQAMPGLSVIEQELSEVSGISPQQNGANTTRKETATMASIMANEGSVRLQGYIRTFNETFFEPVFERLASLVWKYGDAMFFAGFKRHELPSYKINLNTGIGALNKEVQKQSLMDANALIAQCMQMSLQVGDMDAAMRMKQSSEKILLELLPLYGIKDADKFIGKHSELENKIIIQPQEQAQAINAMINQPVNMGQN